MPVIDIRRGGEVLRTARPFSATRAFEIGPAPTTANKRNYIKWVFGEMKTVGFVDLLGNTIGVKVEIEFSRCYHSYCT